MPVTGLLEGVDNFPVASRDEGSMGPLPQIAMDFDLQLKLNKKKFVISDDIVFGQGSRMIIEWDDVTPLSPPKAN